jgi:hypothetical protein
MNTSRLLSARERIAGAFNAIFANFDIRIVPDDVVIGTRRGLGERGWTIRYRVDPDDAGLPSLEFYATHRMTSDSHVRIWADGHVEDLDAIWEAYAYDRKVPGDEERSRERYLQHNREVAEALGARGLYPDGDVNTFLRTGGLEAEPSDPGT